MQTFHVLMDVSSLSFIAGCAPVHQFPQDPSSSLPIRHTVTVNYGLNWSGMKFLLHELSINVSVGLYIWYHNSSLPVRSQPLPNWWVALIANIKALSFGRCCVNTMICCRGGLIVLCMISGGTRCPCLEWWYSAEIITEAVWWSQEQYKETKYFT